MKLRFFMWAVLPAAMFTGQRAAMAEVLTQEGQAPARTARSIAAARTTVAIAVDGDLAEPAWTTAPVGGDFWQRSPQEGEPPQHQTEFRVLYDDDAVYIGVRCFDSAPDKIRSLLTRRDEDSPSDWVQVGIDSYNDKRTAFVFAVNPGGVQRDFLVFNDAEMDDSWDAVWSANARVTDDGWTAELRIPLGQLRFSPSGEQRWGLQVVRLVARSREETVWSPWPKASVQIVSLFGEVEGITEIAPPRRLEVLPYAVGGVHAAGGDANADAVAAVGNLGVDVEYGIGNNFTLSGTVNPDFGQIEADPSEVNLSANETFFTEKRPFFLEGTDIFKFGLGTGDGAIEQLFYSRRIGARPALDLEGEGCRVAAPDLTTIYSAGKLSGKTASGWSFGALDALTARETATVQPTCDDPGRETHVVEPLTNYGVLQVKKDYGEGRTSLGAAVTAVNRLVGGTGLESELHDQAYTTGLQFSHRFAGDRFHATARLIGSYVHGSPEAVTLTQEAPQRYFQRPDAEHLDYDPTRTSLSGAGLVWSIMNLGAKHYRYGVGGDYRSPGLEVNDLGFQHYADGVVQWGWLQYRDDDPGDYLRRYDVNVNAWAVTNWAPTLVNAGGNLTFNFTLLNYWGGWLGIAGNDERVDNGALRGGPALRSEDPIDGWFGGFTDTRDKVRGDLSGSFRVVPATGTRRIQVTGNVIIQALSNFDIRFGPTIAKNVTADQYVAEAFDDADQPHYILARLDQTTLGLTLRLNYTFTSKLSLQFYAQPFISTGVYNRYKVVERPRDRRYRNRFHEFEPDDIAERVDHYDDQGTLETSEYLIDRDGMDGVDYRFELGDFNFRQLRSNLVLRWEYLPGSTVFLVWSHGRSSSATGGAPFALDRELGALADVPGEHVVLLKANYWYAL